MRTGCVKKDAINVQNISHILPKCFQTAAGWKFMAIRNSPAKYGFYSFSLLLARQFFCQKMPASVPTVSFH